jgi:single-stranded DNA-binding protein
MQVTLSGYTGRNIETKHLPLRDGNGHVLLAETTLAVKVGKDSTDWFKLKFLGDRLKVATEYITKGSLVSIIGNLTFEHWNGEDGSPRSTAVITVQDVQIPARS